MAIQMLGKLTIWFILIMLVAIFAFDIINRDPLMLALHVGTCAVGFLIGRHL